MESKSLLEVVHVTYHRRLGQHTHGRHFNKKTLFSAHLSKPSVIHAYAPPSPINLGEFKLRWRHAGKDDTADVSKMWKMVGCGSTMLSGQIGHFHFSFRIIQSDKKK